MKSKLTIIKIGGNVIDNEQELQKVLVSFSTLDGAKILIHGGGKIATEVSAKLGIETKMHEGRRITTKETIDVVTMVYAGLINKKVVAQLQKNNCNAIGLSGADINTILAEKRPANPIDFGYVGDVKKVNATGIEALLSNGITPIFCAISHDGQGELLNTNADTIASEIAIAMSEVYETELIYCFEKKGVLLDVENDDSVIENIDTEKYMQLKEDNIIHAGMLPKMENCFHALNKKVTKVIIGSTEIIGNSEVTHTTLTL